MLCIILSYYGAAVLDEQNKMTVAWRRFDVEVGHLKRLSAHISDKDALSVPATIRAQARKQSAVNRRAIVNLHSNMGSQGTASSTAQVIDTFEVVTVNALYKLLTYLLTYLLM